MSFLFYAYHWYFGPFLSAKLLKSILEVVLTELLSLGHATTFQSDQGWVFFKCLNLLAGYLPLCLGLCYSEWLTFGMHISRYSPVKLSGLIQISLFHQWDICVLMIFHYNSEWLNAVLQCSCGGQCFSPVSSYTIHLACFSSNSGFVSSELSAPANRYSGSESNLLTRLQE